MGNDPINRLDPSGLVAERAFGRGTLYDKTIAEPFYKGVDLLAKSPVGDPGVWMSIEQASPYGSLGYGAARTLQSFNSWATSVRAGKAVELGLEGAAGATGGIGPVLRGQAGVNRAVAEIEGQGGRVLGREITLDAGGVRTRPDLLVQYKDGTIGFVEVKNGPRAGLTPNQAAGFPAIQAGGAIPRGEKAGMAGLEVGEALDPISVTIIHY